MLGCAVKKYDEIYALQRRRVIETPGWRFSDDNVDSEGWGFIPIASREDTDWWTAEVRRRNEIYDDWKRRLESRAKE